MGALTKTMVLAKRQMPVLDVAPLASVMVLDRSPTNLGSLDSLEAVQLLAAIGNLKISLVS